MEDAALRAEWARSRGQSFSFDCAGGGPRMAGQPEPLLRAYLTRRGLPVALARSHYGAGMAQCVREEVEGRDRSRRAGSERQR